MNTVIHNEATEELAHKALRFLTAGSVDDGKSTLIGRLLFDSRAILADQLDALEKRAAGAPIDLSLLTDGLEAEREQGITIDVAYRYFATKARKFIIADAPGHEQYTRNMVTAAAGSDAAVVLVDITKIDWKSRTEAMHVPLLAQTRRHSLLAHLLRVPSIVFAINKLDAIEDDTETAFNNVKASLEAFAAHAGFEVRGVIPVSALRGDNVTTPSANWPWYSGPTLLQVLEQLPVTDERHDGALLHPVQYVTRDSVGEGDASASGTGHQYRAFWGRIAHGCVKAGDEVQMFPSGETAIVAEVRHAALVVDQCEAGQSAGIVLDRQVDISRGDWIHTPGSIQPTAEFNATLAWLDTEPAVVGRKYWVRHGNRWVQARITTIVNKLDIHTLSDQEASELSVNEIGTVQIQTQQALPVEAYVDNRVGGALIVVDPTTNRTSGALLVKAA
ncbi:MAG: sulfate adenylyltransferase [Aquabacterium sp.]|jgi:sulfate adenylyltransferase subunit 1|uniref:sulfate adenylyltransferase subunit 1 n=1 Tax=Aquabacterium sp. TaxID=1872578 RepID=UPI001B6B635D|nr:GTP-binding protein [Aquabacterium sp.]MBP7131585.1 sulfate adenylyltransferase [Aquabacterium sp.]MDQ5926463.1 sulfate adenylyltransferase subunit 1 [Pseudomonadota bacterium]